MAEPEKKLSLQEMAKLFDVTPRTLRHYNDLELLTPEREGRQRYYGTREIARMKLIMRARRFGFPLEQVRQWLNLYDLRDDQRTQYQTFVDRAAVQIAELEAQRDELNAIINELKDLRDYGLNELQKRSDEG